MAEGEFALVRQHMESAIRKPFSQKSLWCHDYDAYAMLADAAAQQRDAVALRQYAPLAEETARRYGHKLYQAIAHRAWGVAHRLAGRSAYAEAEARLNHALALFHELDTRWQVGRTLFELGELALAQNHTANARDHFTRALAAFEAIHAAPDAARTRVALESLA